MRWWNLPPPFLEVNMNYIIIGNLLSLFAMFFLFYAVSQKENHKLITIQGISYFFFASAGIILKGYSGFVQDIIGCVRNILIAKKNNSKTTRNILLVFGVLFGLLLNNKQFIGLFPILGTFQYTLISTKQNITNKQLQLSIIFNAILMTVYSFVIKNYINLITNTVTILLSIRTILNAKK